MHAILATTASGLLGISSGLAWKCKPDLIHFKSKTMNCGVLMGANTYRIMATTWPKDRSFLPSRLVIVVHTNQNDDELFALRQLASDQHRIRTMCTHDYETITDLAQAADDLAYDEGYETAIVCGGAMLYESLIDLCDIIDHTVITMSDRAEKEALACNPIYIGPRTQAKLANPTTKTQLMNVVDVDNSTHAQINLLSYHRTR